MRYVKEILDVRGWEVSADKSVTRRLWMLLEWLDRRDVFGPANRVWTGEIWRDKTGASRISFKEPCGIALPVVAALAVRQAWDSRLDFLRGAQFGLPNVADWNPFEAARQVLLSLATSAARYGVERITSDIH